MPADLSSGQPSKVSVDATNWKQLTLPSTSGPKWLVITNSTVDLYLAFTGTDGTAISDTNAHAIASTDILSGWEMDITQFDVVLLGSQSGSGTVRAQVVVR